MYGKLDPVRHVCDARRADGLQTCPTCPTCRALRYGELDAALREFVAEMKLLGLWESVAVQTLSEFGRTMTTNGEGTDHAWGRVPMLQRRHNSVHTTAVCQNAADCPHAFGLAL